MITSKKVSLITVIMLCFSLFTTYILVAFSSDTTKVSYQNPEYLTKIFEEDIISIDILVEDDVWQEMINNATSEEYIMADVVVNGTKFESVGIRPKGNSSLTTVARDEESDRYSFRLKFDEYIKGQTCFGLDSFVVNNMLTDNTYMKEYISYEIMKQIGVDTPEVGFADIKVNGDGVGLYLAIETYEDSYESRVHNTTEGMVYNVKNIDPKQGAQGGNQGAMMGSKESNGGSLEYLDDDISSYSSIFSNVVGKGDEKDFERVVTALKALSENNYDEYFDVDKILRYLAAHTVVVNLDSYSSSMAQNYYIYENDGELTILPWDYNQSWGGFQSNNASSIINFPIDTPISGVDITSRPLIDKLLSNEDNMNKYHEYLQEIMDNYFANGKWEQKIEELDNLISTYVKNDTTAFCTYEEYKEAVEVFKRLGNLRYESIQGQLDGEIPSTTEEQSENKDKLIPSQDIDLSKLGGIQMGKGNMKGEANNTMPNVLGEDREGMTNLQGGERPPMTLNGQRPTPNNPQGNPPTNMEGNNPEGNLPTNMNENNPQSNQPMNTNEINPKNISITIGCVVLLFISIYIISKKEKNY